jgi:hypothetical protein
MPDNESKAMYVSFHFLGALRVSVRCTLYEIFHFPANIPVLCTFYILNHCCPGKVD